MTLLARGFAQQGHEVYLVTLGPTGNDFFTVDPPVRRIGLDLLGDSESIFQALRANLKRIRTLRRLVQTIRPHTVISFMTSMNVLALTACVGLPVQIVVSERVDPASHRATHTWLVLRALAYRRAYAIVVQTEVAARWFRQRVRGGARISVIPNPVAAADGRVACPPALPQTPYLLGAGRLVYQKGFDLLIEAFALIAAHHEHLRLAIAGDGPELQSLRELAARLHVTQRISFLGPIRELGAVMRNAEVFVLSSRYEGFPNVLLEALASGVPVVATDCPSGPREILGDGSLGLLVPCGQASALAEAVMRIVGDVELRRRLSTPRVARSYELTSVITAWEALLAGKPA